MDPLRSEFSPPPMLSRVLTALLLFLALAPVSAQDGDERFDREFQRGIELSQQKRFDEGIRAFEQCVEWRPEHSVSSYNIGCCYALKGEPDLAFEWLERAADRGFGDMGQNISHAMRDSDLASLREDPRFDAFIAGMKARKRELEAFQLSLEPYWSVPAIYIPEGLAERGPLPVLVVLHDRGGKKEDVISGRWRRIADRLGTALIAPSGKFALSREPGAGMSWFDSIEGYSERHWTYERTVSRAVQAFSKAHVIDEKRVLLAGEGQGAMVAFNVAITGPGLYRGALLLNGLPQLSLAEPRAILAGRMGFRARFLFEEGVRLVPPTRQGPGEVKRRIEGTLNRWGIHGPVTWLAEESKRAKRLEQELLEGLRDLTPGGAESRAADDE